MRSRLPVSMEGWGHFSFFSYLFIYAFITITRDVNIPCRGPHSSRWRQTQQPEVGELSLPDWLSPSTGTLIQRPHRSCQSAGSQGVSSAIPYDRRDVTPGAFMHQWLPGSRSQHDGQRSDRNSFLPSASTTDVPNAEPSPWTVCEHTLPGPCIPPLQSHLLDTWWRIFLASLWSQDLPRPIF